MHVLCLCFPVFMEEAESESKRKTGKLGTSGLALHYANIINQIDTLVCPLRPVLIVGHNIIESHDYWNSLHFLGC